MTDNAFLEIGELPTTEFRLRSRAVIEHNICFQNFYAGIGHNDASPTVTDIVCYAKRRLGVAHSQNKALNGSTGTPRKLASTVDPDHSKSSAGV